MQSHILTAALRRHARSCVRRAVATVTLVCLLITSLSAPGMAAAAPGETAARAKEAIGGWNLPYTVGRITAAADYGGDTVVVNIQDLHCHPEVQRNIGRILALLDRRVGLKDVYVEGNIGRQDTSWIKAVGGKRQRENIVEALIDAGKLTGPEYYSIQSDNNELLAGLERERPYLENVRRLGRMMAAREATGKTVTGIGRDLAALRARYFSPRNRKLELLIGKNSGGEVEHAKLYQLLHKYARKYAVDPAAFPNIDAYVRLARMQRELDYKKVGRQLHAYLGELKSVLPFNLYQALIEQTSDAARLDEFYASLAQIARGGRVQASGYRALDAFFRFIELNQKINPLQLVQEEKRLLRLLHQQQAGSRAEREALFLTDFFECLKDCLDNRSSAEEYAYLDANLGRFRRLWTQYLRPEGLRALEPSLALCREFYAVNTERNRYFLQTAVGNDPFAPPAGGVAPLIVSPHARRDGNAAAMLAGAGKVVVTVTGGFHTDGITQLLDARRISYVVITPNVTRDTAFAGQVYDELAKVQGQILAQTLRNMTNWQELGYASTAAGYVRGIASVLDGNFVARVLKGASRQDAERSVNELLAGVRRQHDQGRLSFRIEAAEGNAVRYVIRLNDTDYRFAATGATVSFEGDLKTADTDGRYGKGIIAGIKTALMDRFGLRRMLKKLPWKADASYDNAVGPVIEEMLFTGLPMLLPSPFFFPALVAARAVFVALHLAGVSPAARRRPALERLAIPALVSAAALLVSGSLPLAIAAHAVANAVVAPALQAAGIRVAKAVLGDSDVMEQCRAAMLDYYAARKEMIAAVGNRDPGAYGAAYDRLLAAARSVGRQVQGGQLAAADAERMFTQLRKQGAFDNLFITDARGNPVLGPWNEMLNAAGTPFTEEQKQWIGAAVDDIIGAFTGKQHGVVSRLRQEIIDNTVPYSAAVILPAPDEVEEALSRSPGRAREVATEIAEALRCNANSEGNFFTLTSSKVPRIAMTPLDNETLFKGIYMHEIGHYLVRLNVIDNAQTEIVTHAISSVVSEDLHYGTMYHAGLAWGRAHRGAAVTLDALQEATFSAVTTHWQALGFPSLEAAMHLPMLVESGQVDADFVQRHMGVMLGGILQGQHETDDGTADKKAALRALFVWSDTVMAEATADVARFRPNPARRAAIVREIQRELRNMTGNAQLALRPVLHADSKAVFSQSPDGNTLFYVPELLDHPDEQVAKALFYEQVFLLLYSQPLTDDASRDAQCLGLYAALELVRTRAQGLATYGGLREIFEKLNQAIYPNVHSESARRRMNGQPLFLQFIDALLYQGRTGKKLDPRVTDRAVRAALASTRAARARLLRASTAEEAKEIILKEIWENERVQELLRRDREEAPKRALEKDLAGKRGLDEVAEEISLQQMVEEILSQMQPDELQDLMEEAREQMNRQMQQAMQNMGQGNGQARQTQQQAQNEAQRDALDAMEQRLASAGKSLDRIQQDIGQMEDLLDRAGNESAGIDSAAKAISRKTGMKPIENRDLAQLQELLEQMKDTAGRLEKESSRLRKDTAALDKTGSRMNEDAAPSSREVREQAGSMDARAAQVEKDVQQLKDLIGQLERNAAKMGQAGRKEAVEERVGATELKKDASAIDGRVKEMERLSEEIRQLMDKVEKGLDAAGREVAEERARQQAQAGARQGEQAQGGDVARDMTEEAQRLMDEARRRLERAAQTEGDSRGQMVDQAQSLVEKAKEQLQGAREEAGDAGDKTRQELDELNSKVQNIADRLAQMQQAMQGQKADGAVPQEGERGTTGENTERGTAGESGAAADGKDAAGLPEEKTGGKEAQGGAQDDRQQRRSDSVMQGTARQNEALKAMGRELQEAADALQSLENGPEHREPGQGAEEPSPALDIDPEELDQLAADDDRAEREALQENGSNLRNRESSIMTRSGRADAEATEFFRTKLGIEAHDAQIRSLRNKIRKALEQVEKTEELTGVRIGDELDEDLLHEARTTGNIQKLQDAVKGKPSQATIFVVDTSGSMGNVSYPGSHMYKAVRIIVKTLLAHVGIKGVYIGACIYGDEKSDQLLSLVRSDDLKPQHIKRLCDIISDTRGSTNDVGTLSDVAGFIEELAKPAVQRAPEFTEGMGRESLDVVRRLHPRTRFNVIHITDGEQAERWPVRMLYDRIRGDRAERRPVPVKIATWGVGASAQRAVEAYGISKDEAVAWGEYAPEARAFRSVDEFETQIEDAVVKFYGHGGKGLRAFGSDVAETVIPQAFNALSPFVGLVRRFSLEVVNRYLPQGKALTEDKLTPSVIARLVRQSSALAQDLLVRILSGDNGARWLMPAAMADQRYGALLAGGTVAVSRAPLKILVKRPDAFSLGSIDDAGRVIVHQSFMDALMRRGPPEQGRALLELLQQHETGETAFVNAVTKILANRGQGETRQVAELKKAVQALRREHNLPLDNESVEQDAAFLRENGQHAYALFHALTRQRYAPLFALADEIIRPAIYEGDLEMPYLGIVQEQDGDYLHLYEPGMAAPVRMKVNGSARGDERLIKLYVRSAGRWERIDPRHCHGSFPAQLGYSLPGSDRIRNFQFTPDNTAQLIRMAKVYNRPVTTASNLLLAGHPGTGKNTLAYMMLALAARPMRMMSMQPRTTQSDLRERTVLVSAVQDIDNVRATIDGKELVVSLKDFPTESTKRLASEVVSAALSGETVILDEIDKINFPEELTALNAFLARTLPHIHPDFRVIAITNEFKEPDESTRSRFTKIDFEYMSENDELDYVMGTVFRDLPEDAARAAARRNMRTVIKIANELRNAARNHEIERFFTTRAVVNVAEHYRFKPEDFRYFRTVLEKVFTTDERLIAGDAAAMIDTALGKYVFTVNGRDYPANNRLPADYDVGMFEYVLRGGKVYCALGGGADRVEVPTRIAPANIEKARQALDDPAVSYFHVRENMAVYWEWMKEIALARDFTVLGPSGTGKTELIKYLLVDVLNLYQDDGGKGFADHYVEVNQRTQGRHLIGVWDTVSGKTVFMPSGLIDAMKTGVPYFIDEADKCPPEELCALNNIAEFRQITLPNGEVINAAPGFSMVKAGNFNNILTPDVQDRSATFIMRHLGKDSLFDFLKRYRDGKLPSVIRAKGGTMYPISDDFLRKLGELYGKLAAPDAVRLLGREPSGRVMVNVLTAVAEHPEEYLRIGDLVEQEYSFTDERDKETVRKAAVNALAGAAFPLYVAGVGQSIGYEFDPRFTEKFKALRDELHRTFPGKTMTSAVMATLLKKIARHRGAVIWMTDFDPVTGEPGSESIVDLLVNALREDRNRINAVCEKHFPELKLKFVAEQHLKKVREQASVMEELRTAMRTADLRDDRLDQLRTQAGELIETAKAIVAEVAGIANKPFVSFDDIAVCERQAEGMTQVSSRMAQLKEEFDRRAKEVRREMLRKKQPATQAGPDFTALAQLIVTAAEQAGVDVQGLFAGMRAAVSPAGIPALSDPGRRPAGANGNEEVFMFEGLFPVRRGREITPLLLKNLHDKFQELQMRGGSRGRFDQGMNAIFSQKEAIIALIGAGRIGVDARAQWPGVYADCRRELIRMDRTGSALQIAMLLMNGREITGKELEELKTEWEKKGCSDSQKLLIAGMIAAGRIRADAIAAWPEVREELRKELYAIEKQSGSLETADVAALLMRGRDIDGQEFAALRKDMDESSNYRQLLAIAGMISAGTIEPAALAAWPDAYTVFRRRLIEFARNRRSVFPVRLVTAALRLAAGGEIDAAELRSLKTEWQNAAASGDSDLKLVLMALAGSGRISDEVLKDAWPGMRTVFRDELLRIARDENSYLPVRVAALMSGGAITADDLKFLKAAWKDARTPERLAIAVMLGTGTIPDEVREEAWNDVYEACRRELILTANERNCNAVQMAAALFMNGREIGIDDLVYLKTTWQKTDESSRLVIAAMIGAGWIEDAVREEEWPRVYEDCGKKVLEIAAVDSLDSGFNFAHEAAAILMSDTRPPDRAVEDAARLAPVPANASAQIIQTLNAAIATVCAALGVHPAAGAAEMSPATGQGAAFDARELKRGRVTAEQAGDKVFLLDGLVPLRRGRTIERETLAKLKKQWEEIDKEIATLQHSAQISGDDSRMAEMHRQLIAQKEQQKETLIAWIGAGEIDDVTREAVWPDVRRECRDELIRIFQEHGRPSTLQVAAALLHGREITAKELEALYKSWREAKAHGLIYQQLIIAVMTGAGIIGAEAQSEWQTVHGDCQECITHFIESLTNFANSYPQCRRPETVALLMNGVEITESELEKYRKAWATADAKGKELIAAILGGGRISDDVRARAWPDVYQECSRTLVKESSGQATAMLAAMALMSGRRIEADALAELKAAWDKDKAFPPQKDTIAAIVAAGEIGDDVRAAVWPGVYEQCCNELLRHARGGDAPMAAYLRAVALLMSGRKMTGEHLAHLKKQWDTAVEHGNKYEIMMIATAVSVCVIGDAVREDVWPDVYADCRREFLGVAADFDLDVIRWTTAAVTDGWRITGAELEELKARWASADLPRRIIIATTIGTGVLENAVREKVWPAVYEDIGAALVQGAGEKDSGENALVAATVISRSGPAAEDDGSMTVNFAEFVRPLNASFAQIFAALGLDTGQPAAGEAVAGSGFQDIAGALEKVFETLALELASGSAGLAQAVRAGARQEPAFDPRHLKRGPVMLEHDGEKVVLLDGIIPVRRGKTISGETLAGLKRKWDELQRREAEEQRKEQPDANALKTINLQRITIVTLAGTGKIDAAARSAWPAVYDDCRRALIRIAEQNDFGATPQVAALLMNAREITKRELAELRDAWAEANDAQKEVIIAMAGAGTVGDDALTAWPDMYGTFRRTLIETAGNRGGVVRQQVAAILTGGREINESELAELRDAWADADNDKKKMIAAMVGAGRIGETARTAWPKVYEDCRWALLEDNLPLHEQVAAILMNRREITERELAELKTKFDTMTWARNLIMTMVGAGRITEDVLSNVWPDMYETCQATLIALAKEQHWPATLWTAAVLMSGREITENELAKLRAAWATANPRQEELIIAMVGAGSVGENALAAWPDVYEDCHRELIESSSFMSHQVATVFMQGRTITERELADLHRAWATASPDEKRTIIAIAGAAHAGEEAVRAAWPGMHEDFLSALTEIASGSMYQAAAVLMSDLNRPGPAAPAAPVAAQRTAGMAQALCSSLAEVFDALSLSPAGNTAAAGSGSAASEGGRADALARLSAAVAKLFKALGVSLAPGTQGAGAPAEGITAGSDAAARLFTEGLTAVFETAGGAAGALGKNIPRLVDAVMASVPAMRPALAAAATMGWKLAVLFAGAQGEYLLSDADADEKYGMLLQTVSSGKRLRVSSAPLPWLVRSPDAFAFATNADGAIIVHESLMDALMAGAEDVTLADVLRHETEEQEYLRQNPGKTYEDYHAAVAERDAALFALARRLANKQFLAQTGLAAADPRRLLSGRVTFGAIGDVLRTLFPEYDALPVNAIAPALAHRGIVVAGADGLAGAARAAGSLGMDGIGVAPRGAQDYGLELLTAKIGESREPTSSVVVPVAGRDVELKVWRRTAGNDGAGRSALLYYAPDAPLAAGGKALLDVLAPLYIGKWVEGNPHVQEKLGLPGFRFAVYKTGDRACAETAVLDELLRLKTAAPDISIDDVVLAFDAAGGRETEGGPAALETRRRLRGVFDAVIEEDAAGELHLLESALKRKSAAGYIDDIALAGVTFADARSLLARFDAYAASADAYIVRDVAKQPDERALSLLRAAARKCAVQGKRLITYYRPGKAEDFNAARRNILQRAKLGASVILDLSEWPPEAVPAAWIREIADERPDAVAGILQDYAPGERSATRFVDGIPVIVRVSPDELFNAGDFNGIAATLRSAKRNGFKAWLYVDHEGRARAPREYRIADRQGFMASFTEQAGKLMESAGMFSVPDEMLQECEDITDPAAWRVYILKTLRARLDQHLRNDPAYVFDRGRLAAQRDGVIADAALAGELLAAVNAYRAAPDGSADTDALAERFAVLQGKDGHFAAGYFYGLLENAGAATIDAQRPFVNPRYAALQKRAVVELQLFLAARGKTAAGYASPDDIVVVVDGDGGAADAEFTADQQRFVERARRLRAQKERMSARQVQDEVDGLLNGYGARLCDAAVPNPLALVEILRILDLADRDEKGLLKNFREQLRLRVLPSAVRAIGGAA